jgi:hypothetical protein
MQANMKVRNIVLLFFVSTMGVITTMCDSRAFEESTTKYDSLFLGIYLGMDKQAFFDHCWEQNRKKVFVHGPTNTSVQYELKDELGMPVMMQFYPTFYNGKIIDMPVTFAYESWAPWNKEYSSDTLFVKILPVFKKWYGDGFKVLEHPTMGTIYYKIDGTRRINLFIRDDQFVQAVFTDLKLEKEMKSEIDKEMPSEN